MIDPLSHPARHWPARYSQTGWGALLLALAIFGLLWILYIPYRESYSPNTIDLPALADGLLLAPGAQWQDWFTQGQSHFWDRYPEWPLGKFAFCRPAFQFVIYLAHFAFGRDWASYLAITYFATAAVGAIAFYIAQTVLKLRAGPSLLGAVLVVLSPPVLENLWCDLACADGPLATLLVAAAFVAVVARRDFLCLLLLFLALLMKETAVWAPLAAAMTIMLRPKLDERLRRRTLTAVAMFLPVAAWLGLRFAFFGGIGGTYGTEGYTLASFPHLIFFKLTHMHYLFLTNEPLFAAHNTVADERSALFERIIWIGTAVVIYALLSLWVLRVLSEAVNYIRYAMQEKRWPIVDQTFLVALWALLALAFFFALAVQAERYATSVVVFAWPALVAEVEKRHKISIWIGLAVCCVMALTRSSYAFTQDHKVDAINGQLLINKLRQMPPNIRQVYVLSSLELDRLPDANPEYVRLVLGISAEIVRVVDIDWNCERPSDLVAFDHSSTNGLVSLTVSLPGCANFDFGWARFDRTALVHNRLYRNQTISYEFPEAYPSERYERPPFYFGRRMTVHIRPSGPARFIIRHGGSNAWFDTP